MCHFISLIVVDDGKKYNLVFGDSLNAHGPIYEKARTLYPSVPINKHCEVEWYKDPKTSVEILDARSIDPVEANLVKKYLVERFDTKENLMRYCVKEMIAKGDYRFIINCDIKPGRYRDLCLLNLESVLFFISGLRSSATRNMLIKRTNDVISFVKQHDEISFQSIGRESPCLNLHLDYTLSHKYSLKRSLYMILYLCLSNKVWKTRPMNFERFFYEDSAVDLFLKDRKSFYLEWWKFLYDALVEQDFVLNRNLFVFDNSIKEPENV